MVKKKLNSTYNKIKNIMLFESGSFLESFTLSRIKDYIHKEDETKKNEIFPKSELIKKKFNDMALFEKEVASIYVASFAADEQSESVKYLRNELRDFDHPFKLEGFHHLFIEFYGDHWDKVIELIIRAEGEFLSYEDSFTLDIRRHEGARLDMHVYPFLLKHEELDSLVEGIKFSITRKIQEYFSEGGNSIHNLLFCYNYKTDALKVGDLMWEDLKKLQTTNSFVQILVTNVRGNKQSLDRFGFYDPRLCKLFDGDYIQIGHFLKDNIVDTIDSIVATHAVTNEEQFLECLLALAKHIENSIKAKAHGETKE